MTTEAIVILVCLSPTLFVMILAWRGSRNLIRDLRERHKDYLA